MGDNAGPLFLVVLIIIALVGFFVWRSMQAGNVGGLSFAQAGVQKQTAVDAATGTAAASASGT